MSNGIGFLIEAAVAILLMTTIGYCVVLNKRLRRLRSDEMALKATISELITATEIAERAIAGLKLTVRECDTNLGERLHVGERLAGELARQLAAGGKLLERIGQITAAARSVAPTDTAEARPAAAPAAASDAQAIVKAAEAFAARARNRSNKAAA